MTITVELDRNHIVARMFRSLLPEAVTVGGSFLECLPKASKISAPDRRSTYETVRQAAVRGAVASALREVGVSGSPEPARGEGGERLWPSGYIGSVSHKGTVVIVALAAEKRLKALGVDIEFVHIKRDELGGGDEAIGRLVVPEGLSDDLPVEYGITVALSMKEAAYKAQFPITGRRLRFDDLRLDPVRSAGRHFEAETRIEGVPHLTVRCHWEGPWIVSAAVSVDEEE